MPPRLLTLAALGIASVSTARAQEPATELCLRIGIHSQQVNGRFAGFAGDSGARPGPGPRQGPRHRVSFAEQQMRRGKYYDQSGFPSVPNGRRATFFNLWARSSPARSRPRA